MVWPPPPGSPFALTVLFVAGALAAVINTMAGGGSLLTLPVLVAVGLPAGVANGTNRVAVVMQGIAAASTFHRGGVRDYSTLLVLGIPMALGAGAGAWAATRLSDDLLRPMFGALLLLWAVVIAVKPGRFLDPPASPRPIGVLAWLTALLIGGYGGFVQAGVGFPLLALLISMLGYSMVRANALKVALVLLYTLLALPIFIVEGQVAWPEGIALAAGSTLGGWLGTRWHLRAGSELVRWVVIAMVALSAALMFFG